MIFQYQLGNTEIILLSAAVLFLLIQLFYYLSIYLRPVQYNKAAKAQKIKYTHNLPPISVVIYAKNDAYHLEQMLPSILEQDYPNFEVIVVNDGSTDESKDVVNLLQNKWNNLYQTYVPDGARNVSRKKLALTVGIKAAKSEIVLFTQANCRPMSNQWIAHIARNFTPETEVVLGYAYLHTKLKYSTLYLNWDWLYRSLQYLSLAMLRWPYRGCGANLAYRKQLFFKAKGFSKYLNLHFGDDDLFINQIVTHKNTKVEISPESQVQIETSFPYAEWKENKLQHDFTEKFINSPAKAVFRLEKCTRFLFLGTIAALIILFYNNIFVVAIAILFWLIRFIVQIIVIQKNKKILSLFTSIITYPLFDIIEPLVNLHYRIIGFITRKRNYTWRLEKNH